MDDTYDMMRRLSPKAQAEVMRRRAAAIASTRQVWYCERGRTCDGRPHDDYTYPHARADQYPPAGSWWDNWFHMSGRGTGKTRGGSNWVRKITSHVSRIALIGRTITDIRQTMVEGDGGLIRACELAGETYDWKPALKEFTFQNGAKAFGWSAEEPNKLRGPEHGAGWLDEPCHMVLIEEVWSNYTLGLRSEGVPGGAKTLLTSSPLPTKWTKARIKEKGEPILDEFGEQAIDEEGQPMFDPTTVLVSVPTSVNLKNLDEGYKRRVINPLRGTRKGLQELNAILLEDVEGALWDAQWHQRRAFKRTEFDAVVVAVDPAGTNKKTSDMTGIVVVGRVGSGDDAIFVVLADYTGHFTPDGWARKTIEVYNSWKANSIVLERYGGDSAKTILRKTKDPETDALFKGDIKEVNAVAGKKLRAEPTAALYEQKAVFHQQGADLAELEDEQLTWVPGITKESPNRIDAEVHGITHLAKRGGKATIGQAKGNLSGSPRNRAPGSAYRKKHWNR